MIESLRVENLESHKDTYLEFSPGLNVIVGESDRGKSGFFRAYKLLTENKPGGNWMFPLFWEGTTTITGYFSEPDCVVRRIKGKSDNLYVLNDEAPISAGTSVPEAVAKALNLDDVNLQTQTERAFLMFETAGERGRILNRISGLDEIDTTLDRAKSDVNRLNKAWESEKAKAVEKEKELELFDNIEEMAAAVDEIDIQQEKLQASQDRYFVLIKLANELKKVQDQIEKKADLTGAETILENITKTISEIDTKKARLKRLNSIHSGIIGLEKKEKQEPFVGAQELFDEVNELISKKIKADKRCNRLCDLYDFMESIETKIEDAEKEIKELAKLIPNICTECGAEL